jgi:hypothetical protein
LSNVAQFKIEFFYKTLVKNLKKVYIRTVKNLKKVQN